MRREITLGNLFSGSGAWELAAKICGIRPVFEAEIEPFPVALEEKRFPECIQLGDVSKINGADIPPVDILTNSSPCQGLSVAGKRAGLDDERSKLFTEAIRITKEMRDADKLRMRGTDEHIRPYIWCWENVPGALSSNSGRDFQFVLREICRIVDPTADVPLPEKGKWPYWGIVDGDTWQVAWSCADASLMGVPQRRKRVFLVADFRGRCAAEILFKPGRITWDFAEIRNAWENTSLSFEDRIDRASRIVSGRVRTGEAGMARENNSREDASGDETGRGGLRLSGEAERER